MFQCIRTLSIAKTLHIHPKDYLIEKKHARRKQTIQNLPINLITRALPSNEECSSPLELHTCYSQTSDLDNHEAVAFKANYKPSKS